MGRVEGKVAFITGAARGQGRAHAVRLAEEGADIIAVDLAPDTAMTSVAYAMATADDLTQTGKLVEGLGRKVLTSYADVRDQGALDAVAARGIEAFGHIDIVAANASILASGDLTWEVPEERWTDSLDINLTGVWRTMRAVVPPMIEAGRGGSIVITSSTAGLRAAARTAAYSSSKHAVVGLMRTLAIELAPHFIRVNTVHPTTVATDMILSPSRFKRFRPDLDDPTVEDVAEVLQPLNLLPIPWLEAQDVSNAVLWLASDEARYVTGVALPVDAGATIK
jgi:SDR family mycofactocin-dependent oxidoreductase